MTHETNPIGHGKETLPAILPPKNTIAYTAVFVRLALESGAGEKMTNEGRQGHWKSARDKELEFLRLFYLENQELVWIGKHNGGITRERARQIVQSGIRRLHATSPRYIRNLFKFGSLQDNRARRKDQNMVKRVSQMDPSQVYALTELRRTKGIVTEAEYKLVTGEQSDYLGRRTFGVATRPEESKPVAFMRRIRNPHLSPDEVRSIFTETSDATLAHIQNYLVSVRGSKSSYQTQLITTITDLAESAFLHPSQRDTVLIAAAISEAGFPVRTFYVDAKRRKHITLSRYTQDIVAFLEKDPQFDSLRRKPVFVLGAPSKDAPSLWNLISNKGEQGKFLAPFGLLESEFGLSIRKVTSLGLSHIFNQECPVPIFMIWSPNGKHYFINKNDREEFLGYAEQCFVKLGVKVKKQK